MEAKLQREIIKFLKDNGCYVLKLRPGMGVPRGAPDIVVLYGAAHCEIEVKASPTAPWQPGQEATLDFLRRNGKHPNKFVYRADPQNWPEIKADLLHNFL